MFSADEKNPLLRVQSGDFCLALDDDLLSHGETPHYHRRYIVSLLSSGRDQVVPTLYGRQAILLKIRFGLGSYATAWSCLRIRYVIVVDSVF